MPVRITRDNVPQMLKAVARLTKRQVLIGIPAENAGRDDGPITNAAIGFINEFGSPAKNIPPRPHLVPGVEKAVHDAIKPLKKAGQAALKGDFSKIDAGFHAAGLICKVSVKLMITGVLAPPLSPKTLAARQRRGHQGASPLIDTDEYLNHISYVVRDKR